MTHPRTKIRQIFVSELVGKTSAEHRVYDSRLYKIDDRLLPSIIVFSTNEEIVTSTISRPRSQDRLLKVIVECYVKSTLGVNVIVDSVSMEVEKVILGNIELKKLIKDCKLESTEITLNSDGDQPVAVASLIFAVSYRTHEGAPEIVI